MECYVLGDDELNTKCEVKGCESTALYSILDEHRADMLVCMKHLHNLKGKD